MKFVLTLLLILPALLVYSQDEFHLNETYPLIAGGTITLHSSDAKVHITGTNRKNVHVKIDRQVEVKGLSWGNHSFNVEITQNNGNLDIIEEQQGSVTMMGYSNEQYEIWIEAPENASLRIKGDDDDYLVKNINGQITMSVDDGNVRLTNCNGRLFDFNIDDGDIEMDKGAGSFKLAADDSDITIKNAEFSSINVRLDDGDLHIETTLKNNSEYIFNSDDSDITLVVLGGGGDFNIRHDDGSVRASERFNVLERKEGRTIMSLTEGSANIEFRTDDSSIRLDSL